MKKSEVGTKEKWLDKKLKKVKVKSDGTGTLCIGIDVGSTYTRCARYNDNENKTSEVNELNADIFNIKGDISSTKIADTCYSNLEFFIKDTTFPENKKDKIIATEAHFVKGELGVGYPAGLVERTSHISKTKQITTFENILANITIQLMNIYQKNEKPLEKCYNVNIRMTLPPKDVNSKTIIKEFKKKLAGHYQVKMPRFDMTINLIIKEENILIVDEPTAIVYTIAFLEDDDDDKKSITEKTAIIIDGGGGTTDKAVVNSGTLVNSFNSSDDFGGKKLLTKIASSFQKNRGTTKPPLASIERALENGILIRGNSEIDISQEIREAKEEVADLIFNSLNNLTDDMDKSLDDIEEIVLHGRLFGDTKLKSGEVISIANFLNKNIKNLAKEINIKRIITEEYVVLGAIYNGWF